MKLGSNNTIANNTSMDSCENLHWRRTAVAAAVSVFVLAGCSDNDENVMDSDAGMGGTVTANVNVAQNAANTEGNVKFFNGGLDQAPMTLNTGANEGVAFANSGTLYQNSDSDAVTGIRALGNAANRADASIDGDSDGYDASMDRMVGSSPGKGLAYVPVGDLLVSADVTDAEADLKVFSATAGPDAEPLFIIDTPSPVWDVFYDVGSDRLYAAQTDGVLSIFDNYSADPSTVDRAITPVSAEGIQLSGNFHGVFVDGNTVVVSDVQDPSSASDGMLFTFMDDGSLNGETTQFTQISGSATMLGNPVDVIINGSSAVVAEKSNDQVLVFDSIALANGDVAPSSSTAFIKPESVEFTPMVDEMVMDATDIDSTTMLADVAVAHNPGAVQGEDNNEVGAISLLGGDLASMAQFDAGAVEGDDGNQSFRTLENVQFDSSGNAYAVFDVNNGTDTISRGIVVLHQLTQRAGGSFDINRDRIISGDESALTNPKGIEIVESKGAMIVADLGGNGAPPALHIYSTTSGDNVKPMFSVLDMGMTAESAIWDIDYDPVSDTLYAAGTKGDILVYDMFMEMGANATVSRSIQPYVAGEIANIHGIVHVASTNQIIATDVGSAQDATDGKLYVIDNAMMANGSVTPVVTIAGADSMLGNPVDLAFDGSSAYIAEKSNDALLVYNNILGLAGAITNAPDQTIGLTKPESVSLLAQ